MDKLSLMDSSRELASIYVIGFVNTANWYPIFDAIWTKV